MENSGHAIDGALIAMRENKELRRRNRLLEEGIRQRDEQIAALNTTIASMKATVAQPAKEPGKSLVCPECGKECATAGGLSKHMKTHE